MKKGVILAVGVFSSTYLFAQESLNLEISGTIGGGGDSSLSLSSTVPITGRFLDNGTRPTNGIGSSYSNGTVVSPNPVNGTVTDVRNRSFDGSGYFTSGGDNADPSFALRLGNGVDPKAAGSGTGIEAVPEPSIFSLGLLGALAWATRHFGRRRAKQ